MNYSSIFDILLILMCIPPSYFLVRTLSQVYGYDELSLLRYEWIPILLSGIFFVAWVLESAYFDITGNFSAESNGVRDATLFAAVSIFSIATSRFAETWGGYVRKMELMRTMKEQANAPVVTTAATTTKTRLMRTMKEQANAPPVD